MELRDDCRAELFSAASKESLGQWFLDAEFSEAKILSR
jgi:hypothetical protein